VLVGLRSSGSGLVNGVEVLMGVGEVEVETIVSGISAAHEAKVSENRQIKDTILKFTH
jgi:hypothetical protein